MGGTCQRELLTLKLLYISYYIYILGVLFTAKTKQMPHEALQMRHHALDVSELLTQD